MDDTELTLIKKAKAGDHQALAALLRQSYRYLYLYLLKLTLHPYAAEDLTQETMVRCIERFRQYDPRKAKLTTWMIQIATNLWLDEKRKKKREQNYVNQQQLSWIFNRQDTEWVTTITALKKLKDSHRIPVILKHYYGYSYEEIAGICSIPIGTVKSRINTGLKKLREELDENE
ncbi:RNA polymerase sigma factor SigY [Bacillaceae bacterium Marseille-Q3522]|nr:RNA polymerase sigma factor SigY [Bacillaceae bacterium Marseille-Q3522]